MEPDQSLDTPNSSAPIPPTQPEPPTTNPSIESANTIEQPIQAGSPEEAVAHHQEVQNTTNQEVLSSSKIEDTTDEKTSEQLRKLKIVSLIITIIAGLGSVVYYVYSMTVWDTMILKPADTVIIQNSDLQLDQAIAKDKATEQSVIDKVMELQKTKRDFIPLDYYVGKIQDVHVIELKIWDPRYYNNQQDIELKIQKTYDIMNKKRVDEVINCTIDKVNVRYFQKWVTMSGSQVDIPSKIKIREDDLIGFRYTSQNNKNTCEIFQVNEVNLQEYIDELNTFSPDKSSSGFIELSGKIEDFFNTNSLAAGGPIPWWMSSDINYIPPKEMYDMNPMGVMMTIYSDNNPRLPLINTICELKQESAQGLYEFFMQANLRPKEDKERFVLHAKISWQPKMFSYSVMSINPAWFPSFLYKDCELEKIDLLDMWLRNVIDSYTFWK